MAVRTLCMLVHLPLARIEVPMLSFLLCVPLALMCVGPAWNAWRTHRRRTWHREVRAAYHS